MRKLLLATVALGLLIPLAPTRGLADPTTAIVPGHNARGAWLSAGAAPRNWISGRSAGPGATMHGTGGNDHISTPSGRGKVFGGAGDDRYFLWDMRDEVFEQPGQGVDTLTSHVQSCLLPDHVENMAIENNRSSGTGNALANIIAGGNGDQFLDGGAGDDVLSGGAGADRFIMQGGTGWDLIRDFEHGVDKLVIGGAFTQFTSFSAVQAALAQVGADTVLRLSPTDAVTFQGRTAGAFTAADFALPQAALMDGLRETFSEEFTAFSGAPTGLDAAGGATWRTTHIWGDRTFPANKEAQYYNDPTMDPNPFTVRTDGTGELDITARPTAGLPRGMTYSSGVVTTQALYVQTYGFFEMRAKIPAGAGFWPAFWLLRADGVWPTSELDVMEILSVTPGRLYMTSHSHATGSHTQDHWAYDAGDLSSEHHTYAVSWQPDMVRWYLDGTEIAASPTPADMHKPMYVIANLAVGGVGSWPGPADGASSATLSIDHIKGYQSAGFAGAYRPARVQAKMLDGTSAADVLLGTAGADRIEGKRGNDTATGGAGADVFAFSPGDGWDVVTDFVPGTDKLLFHGVPSVSVVRSGADTVVAVDRRTKVTLKGVAALAPDDIVYGDPWVSGTAGADLIDRSRAAKPQAIRARDGADTVQGGAGDDSIQGSQGEDVLTGGPGRDTFIFDAWDGHDRITDFRSGVDRIVLRGVPPDTVWVNPARDASGAAGLQIDYAEGQSIFLPGLTSLEDGDIVFS